MPRSTSRPTRYRDGAHLSTACEGLCSGRPSRSRPAPPAVLRVRRGEPLPLVAAQPGARSAIVFRGKNAGLLQLPTEITTESPPCSPAGMQRTAGRRRFDSTYVRGIIMNVEDDLAFRLLSEAQRQAPVPTERSRLHPFRDAIIVFRAKRMSYERIAAILTARGVAIRPSALGNFVRRHCPAAEIERIRGELAAGREAPRQATPPPQRPTPAAAGIGGTRSRRIARDDL